MVRWDGILFDLDGTLLDTSEGVLKAIDDTLGEMHLTMPAGMERTDLIGPPIYDSFRDIFHLSSQEAEIAAGIFRNAYKEKYLFEAAAYDGIYGLLEFLRSENCRMAVATNKRIDYTLMLLRHFRMEEYFDYIKGSDFENRLRKTEIIGNCAAEFGKIGIDSLVMVGDTDHDFIGAGRNGVDFVGVAYGFGFRQPGRQQGIDICGSVHELKDYFRARAKGQ